MPIILKRQCLSTAQENQCPFCGYEIKQNLEILMGFDSGTSNIHELHSTDKLSINSVVQGMPYPLHYHKETIYNAINWGIIITVVFISLCQWLLQIMKSNHKHVVHIILVLWNSPHLQYRNGFQYRNVLTWADHEVTSHFLQGDHPMSGDLGNVILVRYVRPQRVSKPDQSKSSMSVNFVFCKYYVYTCMYYRLYTCKLNTHNGSILEHLLIFKSALL